MSFTTGGAFRARERSVSSWHGNAYCIAETSLSELARHRNLFRWKPYLESVAIRSFFIHQRPGIVVSEHKPWKLEPEGRRGPRPRHRGLLPALYVLPSGLGTSSTTMTSSVSHSFPITQFQGNIESCAARRDAPQDLRRRLLPKELDKHSPAEGVGREVSSNLRENAAAQGAQTRARAVASRCTDYLCPWTKKSPAASQITAKWSWNFPPDRPQVRPSATRTSSPPPAP